MSLMARLSAQWDGEAKRLNLKSKDLRKYIPVGGVRVPAIITRVFDERAVNVKNKKTGQFEQKVISRGFEAIILHPHAIEPPESDALVGADRIKVVLTYKKPENAAVLDADILKDQPTETEMRALTVRHFQTSQMESLVRVKDGPSGQIVVLNGVCGRAVFHNGVWKSFLDVGIIEPKRGLTIASLWPVAAGAGTAQLYENEQKFDADDKASRYARQCSYLVSVYPQMTDASEEAEMERLQRMAAHCGETVMESARWGDDTWLTKAPDPPSTEARKMRADLDMLVLQWPENIPERVIEEWTQQVMLKVTLWPEPLSVFGIDDEEVWVRLAPIIFKNLSFKVLAYVDTKGTETNFGGIGDEKKVNFALALNGMGIIPDMKSMLRKVGMPVTAGFVHEWQQRPVGACGPSRVVVTTTEDLLDVLPDVMTVTGAGADSGLARALLALDHHEGAIGSHVEYIALLPYKPTPVLRSELPKLTPLDGAHLLNAIVERAPRSISDRPYLVEMYGSFPEDVAHIVIYAICDKIIPEEVKAQRMTDITRFMLGKLPDNTAAIEQGSGDGASASASASADGASASASASASAPAAANDPPPLSPDTLRDEAEYAENERVRVLDEADEDAVTAEQRIDDEIEQASDHRAQYDDAPGNDESDTDTDATAPASATAGAPAHTSKKRGADSRKSKKSKKGAERAHKKPRV